MKKELFPKSDNRAGSFIKYDIRHEENPYVKPNKLKKQMFKKGGKKK